MKRWQQVHESITLKDFNLSPWKYIYDKCDKHTTQKLVYGCAKCLMVFCDQCLIATFTPMEEINPGMFIYICFCYAVKETLVSIMGWSHECRLTGLACRTND